MSYEEKGQWVYLVANLVTFGAYAWIILGQAAGTPLTEVDYVPTLLSVIGVAVALSIGGRILVEVVSRSESYRADVRDRDIGRLGEYVGGILLGVAMVVPFGLALAEADHFWIANAIYIVFALSAFVSATVKLAAYRRGF
ncbi:MAG: hypothetical protein M3395_11130 [Chloroflexota bacterium]|nr:hypothetical protein [Chloroflexota bacterium]